MSVIEHCARALWTLHGKEWQKDYPFDSEHPTAVSARERAMKRATVVLEAADYQGAVDLIERALTLVDYARDTPAEPTADEWLAEARTMLGGQ